MNGMEFGAMVFGYMVVGLVMARQAIEQRRNK